jgi:Uncharacterized protein conserved in bacteria (DUF2064)
VSAAGPAVVVLARAPEDELAAVLLDRTLAWAREAAPGADYVAIEGRAGSSVPAPPLDAAGAADRDRSGPAGPPPDRRLAPPPDPLGAGAMDVAARLFAAGHAPVLLATAECPMLARAHAIAALDDLRDECELVIGPLTGGGWYLLGLARPIPELAALPADSWHNPDVMALAFAAAQQAGLTIGLLRPERRLATDADVRAARVDPLVPEEVRAALGGT